MDTEYFISSLSQKKFPITERVVVSSIRPGLYNFILKDHPNLKRHEQIAISELNNYRERYVANYLEKELGELNVLDRKVIKSLSDKSLVSDQESEKIEDFTFGQRVADRVAAFGGSWTFIISFGVFLTLWILVNVMVLTQKAFDPYPFILLNLILSCIAAMQAPVIMMSQNRQEEKDRERAKKDYMINLKAELEIKALHEKIDHLILHQQQQLLEIQQDQIGMMNDILSKLEK